MGGGGGGGGGRGEGGGAVKGRRKMFETPMKA